MQLDWIAIVFRWVHMLAAITAVGGTIFMRFALAPSVELLHDDQRKALHEHVRSRWVKFVMGAILFLLLSGFYNFFRRINIGFDGDFKRLYNILWGVKFLLALVIFFIASALTGRAAALARFRQNAKFWLSVNVVLAVIVVCISGVLRFIPPKAATSDMSQTSRAMTAPFRLWKTWKARSLRPKAVVAAKRRDSSAQGNALGHRSATTKVALKGRYRIVQRSSVAPRWGANPNGNVAPGRCPGLMSVTPSGSALIRNSSMNNAGRYLLAEVAHRHG